MQLLLWPAYSPDMSPIEHVWDLVGRRLARDPRPAASKDELLLRIQSPRTAKTAAHLFVIDVMEVIDQKYYSTFQEVQSPSLGQ
ncbi:hypothetical protein TNCV_1027901 [Trichonephila clavipes]|nr:hypothetical protein TNCV_1027901 [Trichonephila clavipes]